MGLTYDNITVKGSSQTEIAAFLNTHGWEAYVSPTVGDITAVYDNEGADIALALSEHFGCVTLFAWVHDEDYLFYKLYQKGILLDAYCSEPRSYLYYVPFDSINSAKYVTPWLTTGNAAALCQAFDVPDALQDVDRVLKHQTPDGDDDSASDEGWIGSDYQGHLFVALRLPGFSISDHLSYQSLPICIKFWSEKHNNGQSESHFTATFMHTGR